jgi:hypothetical protein
MDTVDLVLLTLALLLLSNIVTAILAWRWRRAALKAQQEVVVIEHQRRAAGYDTGLTERRIAV